jgi:hypothetical protein
MGSRVWYQELAGAQPLSAPRDRGACDRVGTRATFDLDPGFFATGTEIPGYIVKVITGLGIRGERDRPVLLRSDVHGPALGWAAAAVMKAASTPADTSVRGMPDGRCGGTLGAHGGAQRPQTMRTAEISAAGQDTRGGQATWSQTGSKEPGLQAGSPLSVPLTCCFRVSGLAGSVLVPLVGVRSVRLGTESAGSARPGPVVGAGRVHDRSRYARPSRRRRTGLHDDGHRAGDDRLLDISRDAPWPPCAARLPVSSRLRPEP